MARRSPSPADYRTLAALRRELRRFLLFSEDAARTAGIPPQQHQALLAIKGWTEPTAITVNGLAQHLALRHHSAVGLIDRLADRGLIRRKASENDRRRVELELTKQGEAMIARLSTTHLAEMRRVVPELQRILKVLARTLE